MFNRDTQTVTTDMLFNLLLTFIAIFFFTFLMVSVQTKKQEESVQNDNNILITMRWQDDCDVDLWIQLPDGRRVWYSNRDEPPAHLDVDVVSWRKYNQETGEQHIIKDNEEVITIRGVLRGEYIVNAHLYRGGIEPIDVIILVQDVKNRTVIYTGTKKVSLGEREVNFVRFTVDSLEHQKKGEFHIKDVYIDRPVYIVGNPKGAQGNEGSSTEFSGENWTPPQEERRPSEEQEGTSSEQEKGSQ
jgi:hypothetical protein